jgi:hypothetical protein
VQARRGRTARGTVRRVTVAAGSATRTSPGTKRVILRLTAQGRRLLRDGRVDDLRVVDVFTSGRRSVTTVLAVGRLRL